MGFKRLEARHYTAIYWLAQPNHGGLTMAEIAEKCGVTRKSLYEWKKDELFQRELKKEMRRQVGDRIPELIEAMFREAIENGSGKHAELLLKTYGDMLTDQVQIEHTEKKEGGLNIDKLKAKAMRFLKRKQAEAEAADTIMWRSNGGSVALRIQ